MNAPTLAPVVDTAPPVPSQLHPTVQTSPGQTPRPVKVLPWYRIGSMNAALGSGLSGLAMAVLPLFGGDAPPADEAIGAFRVLAGLFSDGPPPPADDVAHAITIVGGLVVMVLGRIGWVARRNNGRLSAIVQTTEHMDDQ